MPRYRYTATALSGKTLHGVTEAASAEALYITLREQDLYMTDAKEVGTNASVYRPLKTPELAEFCRSLGTLLSAGVPLVRCASACHMCVPTISCAAILFPLPKKIPASAISFTMLQ